MTETEIRQNGSETFAAAPQLSIITVTMNDPDGFLRTLLSLVPLKECPISWEWIVVDSSSDDKTARLAESIAMPLRYHRQTPNGIYAAMNLAYELSLGERLWFLNGGDQLCSVEAVVAGVSLAAAGEPELICMQLVRWYRDYNLFLLEAPANSLQEQIRDCKMLHQAMLYNREFFRKFGVYSQAYSVIGDLEHVARALRSIVTYRTIQSELAIFDSSGVSSSRPDLLLKELLTGSLRMCFRGEFYIGSHWLGKIPRLLARSVLRFFSSRSCAFARVDHRFRKFRMSRLPKSRSMLNSQS